MVGGSRGGLFCRNIAVLIVTIGSAACGGGGSSNSAVESPATAQTVQGVAQKGPFLPGSSIIIERLDNQGRPTGEQVVGQTSGNLGRFAMSSSWDGPALIQIRGRYFNENSASNSVQSLTMESIARLTGNATVTVNINAFTHLVSARVRALMGKGSTFEQARNAARKELQTTFGLQLAEGAFPEQLDLTQGTGPLAADNALLLLVSSGMMARSETGRQNVLDLLAADFSQRGSGVDISLLAGGLESLDDTLSANLSTVMGVSDPPDSADLLSITVPSWIPDQDADGTPDPLDSDRDGDSIPDDEDSDRDNDEIPDTIDAFALDPTESLDTDGDGIGDNTDTDDDSDGAPDSSDAFPLDPNESTDTDGDAIGDNADPDDDNDGVPDASDLFPLDPTESVDTDGDGIGNNADPDDDNDGVHDELDIDPLNADVGASPLPAFGDLLPVAALPPVLEMTDGTSVTSAEDWYNRRAPELRRLFQHYMYGYLPLGAPVSHRILNDPAADDTVFGGKAIYKEVAVDIELPDGNTGTIYLSLYLPKIPRSGPGPAPVFLGLSKCPNHTVTTYEGVTIRDLDDYPWLPDQCYNRPNDCFGFDDRGCRTSRWEVENTIDRGYAFASFCVEDLHPDTPDIVGAIDAAYESYAPGNTQTKWGAIAAWAWGVHRVVDYLETDPDIDKDRIIAVGHSRRGKTVLLAAALDERIALVIPHQSGTGGTAPSRGSSESVETINANFPHWFNDVFPSFGGLDANRTPSEYRLPFDQHSLIALVAPRPLLDGAGLRDRYYDPDKVLPGLQTASPVYALLGFEGLSGQGYVDGETATIPPDYAGHLLQYRRDTGHTMNIDYWNAFIDYADLKLPQSW